MIINFFFERIWYWLIIHFFTIQKVLNTMQMRKITLILVVHLLMVSLVFAQVRTVTGKVTDEKGDAIAGASVMEKGTRNGASTSDDGTFSIKVKNGATIIISALSFETKQVKASDKLNIQLSKTTENLTDVVVTAMGQPKSRAKLGYATVSFNNDAINKDGVVSLFDGIAGKVAGANISNIGGPGSSTKVVLRGYGIIGGGNNQPLYVIDGVPLNDALLNGSGSSAGSFTSSFSGSADFGNGMTSVNPNDIESISILKGTAASSIYGSSAKNGVVMITTKRGKAGKLKVEYSGSLNLSKVGKLPDMQSEFGQGWNGQFILSENGSWGPKLDGKIRAWGPLVDNSQLIKPFSFIKNNIRDFYETGTELNNNIALSGGSDITKFYFSYGNVTSDGIVPTKTDYLQRNTFALRTSSVFDKFSINTSFNYINRMQNAPITGQGGSDGATVFESILQIPVDIPISDLRDYKNKFFNVDNYFSPYSENPYYPIFENGITQKTDRFFGNIDMKYKISDAFSTQFRLGGDFANSRTFGWKQPNAPKPGTWNAGGNVEGYSRAKDVGSVLQSSDYFGTINADFLVNYTKDLTKDLNFEAIAGVNYYQSSQKSEFTYITNLTIPNYFNLSNTSLPPTTSDYNMLRRRMGVYAQATLSYKSQLFLTGNARNDWSSTLPINDNAVFYPGVNLSWVASRTFDLAQTPISYLKFRAGYGRTGSDPDPYQVQTSLRRGDTYLGFGSLTSPFNGTPAFGVSNVIGNANLKPIITKELELGAEIRFLKNRIGLDLTYYNKITTGQIFTVPIAPSTGYAQPAPDQTLGGYVQNIGQVSNKGVEVVLDAKPIESKDFSWSFTYTFSKNINNVDYLADNLKNVLITSYYDAESRATPGKPVGEIYALGPLLSPDGKIVVNAKGMPQAAQDKVDYGSTQYKYMMGFSNSFTYKDFTLGFSLDFRHGGVMYSGTSDLLLFTGNALVTTYNDRRPFIVPNSVVASTDALGNVTGYSENKNVIDATNIANYYYPTSNPGTSYTQRIIDKSFLKMRDLTLSYKIPESLSSKIKASQMSLGIYARNLLLWTPKDNVYVDPEGTNLGNDLAGEIGEFRAAPTSKQFGAILKITF